MTSVLKTINTKIYKPCSLIISGFVSESEGSAYEACQFTLNDKYIICRTAKITPKKVGQFVTFWNRNKNDVTQPFCEDDAFDFYVINVCKDELLGQFVIPKAAGISHGLVTTSTKEGKRGFRVYPPWDVASSSQAKRTQVWQLKYFVSLKDPIDFELVKIIYASQDEILKHL
ncbi:MepB family protein [Formosa sp. PL04]|uniref:MepB family protein n=1 Tax=Formosa sp. PL04 TaxID=3081755 RepID=UPI0029810410|nr:MepB family protein [Formosa sp. PL04]MDW5287491.1 MepB family protein [Formosa sp. PL04]